MPRLKSIASVPTLSSKCFLLGGRHLVRNPRGEKWVGLAGQKGTCKQIIQYVCSKVKSISIEFSSKYYDLGPTQSKWTREILQKGSDFGLKIWISLHS